MNELDTTALARELLAASSERVPVAPLTERFPGITVTEAYAVQLSIVRMRIESGRRVVGKKIGLTSKVMQDQFGVREPDYGHLFDDMIVPSGQVIDPQALIQPRCEAEIAFVLGQDLAGPGVSVVDVLRATEAVLPALEIIDSRIQDWRIQIQDTVADNASSALVCLGERLTPVDGLDLRLAGMVLERNGEVVATGSGAAALGHPAWAVAWLANKLHEFGIPLRAGEIILSGSLAPAPPVASGDFFRAEFDRLGSVSARFGK